MTSRPQEPPEGREDLEALILRSDLDAVLQRVTVAEVAPAWCRHSVRSRQRTDDAHEDADFWAVSFALEAVLTRHPAVRTLRIATLLDQRVRSTGGNPSPP
jgi:hypothetical protein